MFRSLLACVLLVSIGFASSAARANGVLPYWSALLTKAPWRKRSCTICVSPPEVNDDYGDVDTVLYAVSGKGADYRQLDGVVDDVLRVRGLALRLALLHEDWFHSWVGGLQAIAILFLEEILQSRFVITG
mgnify:CR=1 FL=1